MEPGYKIISGFCKMEDLPKDLPANALIIPFYKKGDRPEEEEEDNEDWVSSDDPKFKDLLKEHIRHYLREQVKAMEQQRKAGNKRAHKNKRR